MWKSIFLWKNSFFYANCQLVHTDRKTDEGKNNLEIRLGSEIKVDPLTKEKSQKSKNCGLYNQRKDQMGTFQKIWIKEHERLS